MVGTIPPWSSVVLSGWGIEYEEEDLASGGRRESGRIRLSPPYRSSVVLSGWGIEYEEEDLASGGRR